MGEEVCKRFCVEFVKVIEKDGKTTRAILPHCCRGLKRELINDMQALLAFVWRFLPKDRTVYSKQTQVRFSPYKREPRRRQDLQRLKFSRPELDVDVSKQQLLASVTDDIRIEVKEEDVRSKDRDQPKSATKDSAQKSQKT